MNRDHPGAGPAVPLAGGVIAAGIGYALTRAGVTRSGARWLRTNHAGRPVTLLEGPAAAVGLVTGVLIRGARTAPRSTAADLIAITTAAVVGGYDDLAGSTRAKGFRGHLGALRQGRVTSGTIKLLGVGAAALAAALVDDRSAAHRSAGVLHRPARIVVDSGLVAAAANLVNLLDLRPGRAAKAVIAAGLLTAGLDPRARSGGGPVFAAGPLLGAAAGVLPADLAGRSMLGDCGANALGAGLGRLLTGLPLPVRIIVLAGLVGLNLASERVSFTAVIAGHPWLAAVDRWGRTDQAPSPTPDAGDGDDGDDGL